MHFLINGPGTLKRIVELFTVVDSLTFTTSKPALKAAYSRVLKIVGEEIVEEYSDLPKEEIFKRNVELYQRIATKKTPKIDYPYNIHSNSNFETPPLILSHLSHLASE